MLVPSVQLVLPVVQLYLFQLLRPVQCFNLDTQMPILKFGDSGTYFGYSVAAHFSDRQPLLLVGAPKAESGQVGTKHAGALFSCPVNSISSNATAQLYNEKWCDRTKVEYPTSDLEQEIDYYAQAPNSIRQEYIFTKDFQWLGATVCSDGQPNSRVLVCAPNLIYDTAAYIEGACFLLRNDLSHVKRIHTCGEFTKKNRHNDYGVCQEGFSAVLSEKYQVLATGLPGASRWIGGSFAQDIDEALSTLHSRRTAMVRGDDAVENVIKAHSYFGYSMAVGLFGFWFENGKANGNFTLVAGCPRCNETGAVYFMPFGKEVPVHDYGSLRLLSDHFNLTGDDSFAASFGYSLSVVDIDNDGADDLLVGAPFFYDVSSDEVHGGRVYVYFSKGSKSKRSNEDVFYEAVRLSGPKDSMFGAAITGLGDINHDNYNDVAVGAPYHGSGGAVYVYLGADRNSFELKPVQIILGEDIVSPAMNKPLVTFGWSLSGGSDVDNNGYADLVVGAYKSDAVVLLRSKPIIHLLAIVEEADLKPIDLDTQRCHLPWAKACITIRTKLRIKRQSSGTQLDWSRNMFTCRLKVVPYGTSARRAEFAVGPKYEKDWLCGGNAVDEYKIDKHELFIRDSNRDWLNPLKFVFSVSLATNLPQSVVPSKPLPDINNYPVLDMKSSVNEFTIDFNKKCGSDDKCVSDLVLQCSFLDLPREPLSDTYVKQVGKDDELDLQYRVVNNGERAYESSLFVTYNEDELERPMLMQKTHHHALNFGKFANGLIEVLLGNPLEPNTELVFSLKFKLTRGRSEGLGKALVFDSLVNSTSVEQNELDNRCSASVKVIKKAELEIVGTSEPQLVYFGGKTFDQVDVEYEEDIGPQVVHTYVVKNAGPWGVNDVTINILHPHQISSPYFRGKWALYLMYLPIVEVPIPGTTQTETRNCYVDSMTEYVNPLEIKIGFPNDDDNEEDEELQFDRNDPKPRKNAFIFAGPSRDYRVQPETVVQGGESFTRVIVTCDQRAAKRTAKCFQIRCLLDYLEPNIPATIRVRSRLWNSTFVEDYRDLDHILIESFATVTIDPRQGIEETNYSDNEATAITRAQPDMPKISEDMRIPLWIIVLAVLGGIFILLLVVVVLWKCGFFKRVKYYDEPLYTAEYTKGEYD